jgi:hypothetical protein
VLPQLSPDLDSLRKERRAQRSRTPKQPYLYLRAILTRPTAGRIPAEIRKRHALIEQSRLAWIDDGSSIRVVPLPEGPRKYERGSGSAEDRDRRSRQYQAWSKLRQFDGAILHHASKPGKGAGGGIRRGRQIVAHGNNLSRREPLPRCPVR